jgi:predicted aconitase
VHYLDSDFIPGTTSQVPMYHAKPVGETPDKIRGDQSDCRRCWTRWEMRSTAERHDNEPRCADIVTNGSLHVSSAVAMQERHSLAQTRIVPHALHHTQLAVGRSIK